MGVHQELRHHAAEASLTSHHLLQPSISIRTHRRESSSPPQRFRPTCTRLHWTVRTKPKTILKRGWKSRTQVRRRARMKWTFMIWYQLVQKTAKITKSTALQTHWPASVQPWHAFITSPTSPQQTHTLVLGWSPPPLSQCHSLYHPQSLSLDKPRSNLSLQSPSNSSLKSMSERQRPLASESLQPSSSPRL